MSKLSMLKEGESISNGKLHIIESYDVETKIDKDGSQKILTEAKEGGKALVLKPRIEAIHAGRTRNHNIYPSEKLRGDISYKEASSGKSMPTGVYSFTMPYPKPMITDHYPTADNTTGRITNAQFIRDAVGREKIVIIPEITSPDAIQKVLDGRYLTVSVGSTTDSARCNICGKDIINEGWCEHEKGQEYDGVVAGWIIGNIWFDECSWVAVPADTDARVIDAGEAKTMEAYIEIDSNYYNLSGEHGAITITEAAANTLGLVVGEDSKGGSNTVSKPTEVTVKAEELEALKESAAKVAGLEEKILTLESTVADKEKEINSAKEASDAKDTLIAEKDTALQEKDTTITTLTNEKSALEEKVTTLESKITDLDQEKQTLLDKATEAASEALKDLVERVVNLKIALGKPGVENKEDAVSEHMARSIESLKDSYVDLLSEVTKSKGPFISEKVQRPGLSAKPGEPQSVIEGSDPDQALEELDAAAILTSLLSGKFRKQK